MRIAQISPLWERVPPPAYGGTEAVVHALTEGLVARGHEVVLFASGDSLTSAELRFTHPRSLRTEADIADPVPYDWLHIAAALADGDEFDLIHNHSGELPMAMCALVGAPMLTTMHCLLTPDTTHVWERYQGYFNAISQAAWRTLPEGARQRNCVGVIYNGIDVAGFPFQANKDEHLLFLSRIAPEKGPHVAIAVARRLGMRLLLAGKIDRVDRDYFASTVQPLLDDEQIRYVGEVTREETKTLYAEALALLLPVDWEEPFGLVIPEAMATGTPVIAFRRGAAPELIRHGETGFLVDAGDVDGMAAAVRQVDRIDPFRCRRHVEENFDVSRMVDGYLEAYEQVLVGTRRSLSRALVLPRQRECGETPSPIERLREVS
jgi:glycosyltransferase involved in cell wall biosynthesis